MFTSLSSECAFGQLYDTEMNDQMIGTIQTILVLYSDE